MATVQAKLARPCLELAPYHLQVRIQTYCVFASGGSTCEAAAAAAGAFVSRIGHELADNSAAPPPRL